MKNTLRREEQNSVIALQFRALIYFDAASDEDSRCKRKQWTRNGKKLETIPAWDVNKVKSKKEVTKEAQKNNNKLHFASLMDLCHLKNSELEPHFQKFKGKTCASSRHCERRLWSLCSFMPEQGSSASPMTAAKVMDVIVRPLDCDGQAADAISANTKVQNGGRSKTTQNSQIRNVRKYGYVFQNIKWPKSCE